MAKRTFTLAAPGTEVAATEETTAGVRVLARHVSVGADRGAGERARIVADDDDVLELEWDDGLVEVLRVDDYAEREGRERSASGEVLIGTRRAVPGERGEARLDGFQLSRFGDTDLRELARKAVREGLEAGLDWAKDKALERLRELALQDLLKELDERDFFGAVLRALEDRTTLAGLPAEHRAEALYKLGEVGVERPLEADETVGGRVLLLVHGTFSNTESAFAGLFNSAEWVGQLERYQAAVAYQHYTVGRSPAENAHMLARALDRALEPGAEIDLVSHSRGGLVGESILPARDPAAWQRILERLRDAAPDARDLNPGDLPDLIGASELMATKTVRRFARVACPILGTSLMGDRVDRLASVIFTVARLFGADVNPFYTAAKGVIRFLLKVRKDPWLVPGLAPMSPEARLLGVLNHPRRRVPVSVGEMGVATKGRGFLQRVKVGAAWVLFGGDNDLVVDTENMFGGARPEQRWLRRKASATVDHTSYFSDDESRDALDGFLRGDTTGWEPTVEEPEGAERGERGAAVATAQGLREPEPKGRPRLVLVPGIMGSHLADEDGRLWFDYGAIVQGRFPELDHQPGDEIRAEAVMAQPYRRFVEWMSDRFDVRLFPFDWRRSVQITGAELAKRLREELDGDSERPVHVVAHSMGGLVLRGALHADPELDDALRDRGGRIIMAGTPNRGSFELLHLVAEDQDSVLDKVALLDLHHDRGLLATVIRGFPGVLEMLPWDAQRTWGKNGRAWRGGARPEADDLERAQQVQRALGDTYPKKLIYIAGSARETLSGIDADGSYAVTDEGDGRVAHRDGIPPGDPDRSVETYYLNAVHGSLLDHGEPSFEAIAELLARGETRRLPREPVEPTFFALARSWMGSTRAAPRRPRPDEVLDLMLCREGAPAEERVTTSIEVEVVADSLQAARYPVMVGHYVGDEIVGPEAILDGEMGGALRLRRALGNYAGPHRKSTVHLRLRRRPPGAVVVGLGHTGQLSEARLRESVEQAVVDYALEHHDLVGPAAHLGISSLLMGAHGALDVRASVRAILGGVDGANARLRAQGLVEQVDTVELIDLYEGRARHALREVQRWANTNPRVELSPPDRVSCGGARRTSSHQVEDLGQWARKISIERDEGSGDLTFRVLTERARAEATTTAVGWRFVSELIAQAKASSRPNRRDVAGTTLGWLLYKLLMPDAVTSVIADGHPLQLVLDATTAAIPWELLEDSPQRQTEPPVTRIQLTRQLVTERSSQVLDAPGRRVVLMADLEHAGEEARRLPEAKAEADVIHGLLSARFEVKEDLVQPGTVDPIEVLGELFRGPVRILHIAAHGDLGGEGDAPERARPGVLLGDGRRLDASVLGKLDHAPAVVFLNCCHLGDMSGPVFASSVARELIAIGTRVVVAAGWAVDDRAARTFAEVFYRRLLDREPLRVAVRDARQQTYLAHPGCNTWGAFQVYGDPGFVLLPDGISGKGSRGQPILTESEVEVHLEGLRSTLLARGDAARVRRDADELYLAWRKLLGGEPTNGRILQAFGELYLRLMRPSRAIELLERAFEDPKRRASLGIRGRILDANTRRLRVERSADWAVDEEHLRASEAAASAVMAELEREEDGPGESARAERHNLLGSFYKDHAAVGPKNAVNGSLYRSFSHYGSAFRCLKGRAKAYPTTVLALQRRVAIARKRGVEEAPAQLGAAMAWVRRENPLSLTDFWAINSHADSYLVGHLDYVLRPEAYLSTGAEGTTPIVPHPTLDCVRQWFGFSYSRMLTPWHWHSVVEIVRWLMRMFDLAKRGPGTTAARESIAAVERYLCALEAGTEPPVRDMPAPLDSRTDWIAERLEWTQQNAADDLAARDRLLRLLLEPGAVATPAELPEDYADRNPYPRPRRRRREP